MYKCLFLTTSKDFGINVKMAWKASQHLFSLWYSVDALHLSLQALLSSLLSLSAREMLGIPGTVCSSFLSSLLSCSPFSPLTPLFSQLSPLASWCTLFVSHLCSPLPHYCKLHAPVLNLNKKKKKYWWSIDPLWFLSHMHTTYTLTTYMWYLASSESDMLPRLLEATWHLKGFIWLPSALLTREHFFFPLVGELLNLVEVMVTVLWMIPTW